MLTQIGAFPAFMVLVLLGAIMFVDASPVVGLLLPGDVVVVSVLAVSDPVEAVLASVGVMAGTMASWSLFFVIGRRVGPGVRRGRIGRWLGTRWDTAEQLVNGRGARVLLLVQFLPVVNAVVPMVAGVLGMSWRQFVRYAAAGSALWAVVFSGVGVWAGLASNAVLGGSPLGVLVFAAPGFVAGWVIMLYLRRELVGARAPMRLADPVDETAEPAPVEHLPLPASDVLAEPVPLPTRPLVPGTVEPTMGLAS